MARYPLHPRLARLVIEAVERGAGEEGCAAAALLSAGARRGELRLLRLVDSPMDFRAKQHFEQIRRMIRPPKQQKHDPNALPLVDARGVSRSRRAPPRRTISSAGLRRIGHAGVRNAQADFLVAVDIEDRSEHALPLVRLYCAIEPDWLVDLFPARVRERSGVEWNRSAERVEEVSALLYDDLVIQETRSGAPDPEKRGRSACGTGPGGWSGTVRRSRRAG